MKSALTTSRVERGEAFITTPRSARPLTDSSQSNGGFSPRRSYRWTLPLAAIALMAAIYVTAPQARTVSAGPAVSDAEAQGIVARHCLMCHSRHPSHPAFREPLSASPFTAQMTDRGLVHQGTRR